MINIAWALPGGNNPPFTDQTVSVGDQAVFSFKWLHGLFKVPNATCPGELAVGVGAAAWSGKLWDSAAGVLPPTRAFGGYCMLQPWPTWHASIRCPPAAALLCPEGLSSFLPPPLPVPAAVFEDVPPLVQIQPPTQDGSATVTFDQPGIYW